MASLGNAWHVPANPEPRGAAGMRDPVFPTVDDSSVTIGTGNQFQGAGNAGNQLQDGSTVFYRTAGEPWTAAPLLFSATINDNKYYAATIPITGLAAGSEITYYLRVAYDDHDTTYLALAADGTTSNAVADEATAQASPFSFSIDTAAIRGRWDPPFALPNVAIHAHVLTNGRVLMWGRRDSADQSLDVAPPSRLHASDPAPAPPATCTPFVLDLSTQTATPTPQPQLLDGTHANLFCSGHAWLADGRLLVAGGHLADSAGLPATTVYDPETGTWTSSTAMGHGRWYPSVTTLPDGSALIISGTYRGPGDQTLNNETPDVWKDGALSTLPTAPLGAFDLYPRLHLISDGRIVMTGSLAQTRTLDPGTGQWSALPTQRDNAQRDYAPSVLYDEDKVIYIGGGNPPTANAERIDLGDATPQWTPAAAMSFPRRQHNATILADGTVLVTGGTRSGGSGPPENFNNLDPGQPVHVAELWDPATDSWQQLAAEATDRCYHATAVLLPDGRVLSAGGGEFFPVEGIQEENDPLDSHHDAQIFSPPYLFRGPRPAITAAPERIDYRQTFTVGCDQPAEITKITLIRLSSTTHSFNASQRFLALTPTPSADTVKVTAPATPDICPPGPYLLFAINSSGVPSLAKTLLLAEAEPPATGARQAVTVRNSLPAQDVIARRTDLLAAAHGTKVVIGLRGSCPYGIAACWGGANEALSRLPGVALVDPVPDAQTSTATVYLEDDGLPRLGEWATAFHSIVNDSYVMLGVEITLTGSVLHTAAGLVLAGEPPRPEVALKALTTNKIQMQPSPRVPAHPSPQEQAAFSTLVLAGERLDNVTVTGPLREHDGHYSMEIRIAELRQAGGPSSNS